MLISWNRITITVEDVSHIVTKWDTMRYGNRFRRRVLHEGEVTFKRLNRLPTSPSLDGEEAVHEDTHKLFQIPLEESHEKLFIKRSEKKRRKRNKSHSAQMKRKVRDQRSIGDPLDRSKSSKQTSRYGESSEDSKDPMSRNKLYLTIMMVLLILTTIVVTFMLLPLPKIPKNAHIPVILWSTLILFSVSLDVESSVHPRVGLGWTFLETFLIWITLPMRIRSALFYTVTLAAIYLIVTSCRVNNHFHLGRQVK